MNYWLIVIGSLSLILIETWIVCKILDRYYDSYHASRYISREHYEFMRFYRKMKQIQKQDR